MKVDGALQVALNDPGSAARSARLAASLGYDAMFAAEMAHDPFLPVALAAGAADIDLGTNIAVAFARNPMTVAATANDLQLLTGGRFVLGLGSQVKAHITRRFSMPWSQPAARMREFILALQAIWDSWHNGTRLDFDGQFYRHTLSNPLFDPGPNPHGRPAVWLAAVGPRMTEVAGEVADGVIAHAFTTVSYLADVTLPALRRGMDVGARTDPPELSVPVFLATGPAGADLAGPIARVRRQLAFYASTPAYRGVLDHHGWGDAQEDFHRLSREGRWAEMSELVDDAMLHTFAVVADADELAEALLARFGGLAERFRLTIPFGDEPEVWGPVISRLKVSNER